MLITKIQQLLAYDCGQSPILISELTSDVRLNVYEIIQKSKDGKTSKSWKSSSENNDLTLIEPNNLYLITNKENFLEYEFPGMVDPLAYCLSSISDAPESQYSVSFVSFENDSEELIIKLNEFYLLANNINFLVAKAKKGNKEYNSPWNFYLDEIELTAEIPGGYYNLKPSSIQTSLYSSQQNYISVSFDLSLLNKVSVIGVTSCIQPLSWDCIKQSKGLLVGYCRGDCPKGYKKSNYGITQYCEIDLDSDSDSDSDSDLDLNLDSDSGYGFDGDSDSNLDSDLDSDINYYNDLIDEIFSKPDPNFNYYAPPLINDSDSDIDSDMFLNIELDSDSDGEYGSDYVSLNYKESIIYILENLEINDFYREFLLSELERILNEEGI